MSSQPEDFKELRSLLTLKKREQPPPGYFDYFSDRVIARLEAEEFSEYSSWWQWLVDKFDAKPVLACLYGVFVSGLLLAGFRLSQMFEAESRAIPALPWLATTPASSGILPGDLSQSQWMDTAALPPSFSVSMSPLLGDERAHSLFGGPGLKLQPITFNAGE